MIEHFTIEPRITIELDDHADPYEPGESMSGSYRVDTSQPRDVKAVELSVLWYTIGQGEEDLAVHHFLRRSIDDHLEEVSPSMGLGSAERFQTVLPNSPLSYDGVIVKVQWCVRVRVFLARGKEVFAERPFRLGKLPPANVVPS